MWSGDWDSDPRDAQMLEMALRNGRILITLDKDFGELIFLKRRPHSGVLRHVGFRASEHADVRHRARLRYKDDVVKNAMITVESGRVRVRQDESANVSFG